MNPRPIFVHACWRTGSTYVWSKFREQPRYRCYLEPLHEAFIASPASRFEAEYQSRVTEKMRHPALRAHYFAEYPFRPAGGVEKFAAHFPYQRYCLAPGDEDPALEEYIGQLLHLAWGNGQIPLLQFNRGLLRSQWLRQKFNSIDVLLLRDPWETWHSYCSFPHRYFITVTACIAGQNRDSAWFQPLRELLDVPCFAGGDMQKDLDFYYEFTGQNEAHLPALFCYFYLLTALHNLRHADVVLDLDHIAASPEARDRAEKALLAHGIELSLADCRLPVKAGARHGWQNDAMQRAWALLERSLREELLVSLDRFGEMAPFLSTTFQEITAEFVEPSETCAPVASI